MQCGRIILFFTFNILIAAHLFGQQSLIIREYDVKQSRQGVAVDSAHFYVVNNSSIDKYNKSTGTYVGSWRDTTGVIKHLNSGIIINGILYCCNSNYPNAPMASSIEMFDPWTLDHVGNHSFGVGNGSATWLDYYQGSWYVTFAHYTGRGSEPNKDNSWTRMVKFDTLWRQMESWIFPDSLLKEFEGRSNSGGFIQDDGTIYCTGHDNHKLYKLKFPVLGYTLEWESTVPMGGFGQGVAQEKHGEGETWVYGVLKKSSKVVVSRLP